MSYENLASACNRIKQLTESNWKNHPCIHSCVEPLLCAKHHYKPCRDRARTQIMDATLGKLFTQTQEGTPYRTGKLLKLNKTDAYCIRRGQTGQP